MPNILIDSGFIGNDTTGADSPLLAPGIAVEAGDLIIVNLTYWRSGGAGTPEVLDDDANDYAILQAANGSMPNQAHVAIAYATAANDATIEISVGNAGGPTAVYVTFSYEIWRGDWPTWALDTSGSANKGIAAAAGNLTPTTGAAITRPECIVSAVILPAHSSASTASDPPTGFTSLGFEGSAATGQHQSCYRNPTNEDLAALSVTWAHSLCSDGVLGMIAVFYNVAPAWFRQSEQNFAVALTVDIFIPDVLPGSLLVVDVRANGYGEGITVEDDLNGAHSESISLSFGSITVATYYFENAAGGDTTITLTCDGAGGATVIGGAAHEYVGMVTEGAPDQVADNDTTGTVVTSGPVAGDTFQAQELVHGCVAFPAPDDANYVVGGDLTHFRESVVDRLWTGDGFINAIGTPEAEFTLSVSHNCGVLCSTFRVQLSPGGGPSFQYLYHRAKLFLPAD